MTQRQDAPYSESTESIEERNMALSNLMLKNDLLSSEQLHQCVKIQIQPSNTKDLAQIAASLGFITEEVAIKLETTVDANLVQARAYKTTGFHPDASDEQTATTLFKWLTSAMSTLASDLHIMSGEPITVRLDGKLIPYRDTVINRDMAKQVLMSILTPEEKKTLYDQKAISKCMDIPGNGGRTRISIYYHSGGINGVFRLIPKEIPQLNELNLPSVLTNLVGYTHGLVLITGPISCGKTTTLASLVKIINERRKFHIVTIEEPIEFLHQSKQSLVTQREVGKHTQSYANALRSALREDPDVIVVGEMRDVDTARLAITAAETGHLVLTTLHTENAVRSINRVIDMFPHEEQPQIRTMLSESLRGVVSQKLVTRVDADGMVPIVEIMFNYSGIANLIRDRKLYQLKNMLKITAEIGNISMEDYARKLFWNGIIDNPDELEVTSD